MLIKSMLTQWKNVNVCTLWSQFFVKSNITLNNPFLLPSHSYLSLQFMWAWQPFITVKTFQQITIFENTKCRIFIIRPTESIQIHTLMWRPHLGPEAPMAS